MGIHSFLRRPRGNRRLARASMVAAARNLRQQPVTGGLPWRQIGSDLFRSPSMAWGELTAHFRESRYRNYGIYEAEKPCCFIFATANWPSGRPPLARRGPQSV